MLLDFLIVYDRADRSAAEALRTVLENDGASCLLRASDGVGQAIPTNPLNRIMSESSVAVLVVSERAGPAFWQQDDIATIRKLLTGGSQANRIVLVLVSVTARSALPRDLASARAYDVGLASWAAIAANLAAEVLPAARPATVSLGHTLAIADDIYDDMMKSGSAQPSPVPDSYRQRFEGRG